MGFEQDKNIKVKMAPTDDNEFNWSDKPGHSLIATYLGKMRSKQEQPTKKHIDRLITNAFNTLQTPIKQAGKNKVEAFFVLDFNWLGAPLNQQ